MAKNFIEELTSYRVKVEKDGKEIVNVPGIFALPGALFAPKMSIVGAIGASLLGCNIHLQNEDGKNVNVSKEIKKVTDTVVDAAKETAKSIRDGVNRAWDELSADDPAECPVGEENKDEEPSAEASAENKAEETAADLEKHEAEEVPAAPVENKAEKIVAELEKHEAEEEIPTIQVENPNRPE